MSSLDRAIRVLPTPEQYASCPNDGKILQFYNGQFDSVYILLHPFFRPHNIELEMFCPEKWPSKHEMIEKCETVFWKKILELSNFNTLSEIDIALRTSIGGLNKEQSNDTFAVRLTELTSKENIICPTEGELSPLIENQIYKAIMTLGYEWLWVGNESGTERKLYWIEDLINKDEIPVHGCVFTHDHSLLVTTHWDSHCSFLCSSKAIIERILAIYDFEGFYCTEKTEVYWGLYDI